VICCIAECDVHLIVGMLINDPSCWDCARGHNTLVQSDEEVEKGAVAFGDLAILPCALHKYASQSSIFTPRQSKLQNNTASIEATMIDIDGASHSHVLLQRLQTEVQEP
jgi:hypothetical protein